MDDLPLDEHLLDEEMADAEVLPLDDEGKALFKRMAKLRDKLLRFELHFEYMSKYHEEDRLPKGLRIIKDPYFGEPLEDFDKQWYDVLQAASKRLLEITVRKLEYLVASLNQQWLDLEGEVDDLSCSEDVKIAMLEKVHAWATAKEPKLREIKNAKWERDMNWKPRQRKRPASAPKTDAPPQGKKKPTQVQTDQKVKKPKGKKGNPKVSTNQKPTQNQYKKPQQGGKKHGKGKNWNNYRIPKVQQQPQSSRQNKKEDLFREMMMSFFTSFMKK